MGFWKKGLALLAALTLMMSGAACQKRTLEDATSWEDAAEICLGGHDMVICKMEGNPGEMMLMISVADISDSEKFIENCSALSTCLTMQSVGLSKWPEIRAIVINMFNGSSENYIGGLCIYDMPGEKYNFGLSSVLLKMKENPKALEIRRVYMDDPIFSQIDGPTNYGWKEE